MQVYVLIVTSWKTSATWNTLAETSCRWKKTTQFYLDVAFADKEKEKLNAFSYISQDGRAQLHSRQWNWKNASYIMKFEN